MKLGIDWDADKKIRDLISSWCASTRFILIILTFLTLPFISSFVYQFISYIFYHMGYSSMYFWIKLVTYYFSISLFNSQFGGFFMLAFFLIWKKGKIANIILACPIKYPGIAISNVWLRAIFYFAIITGFGFMMHDIRILFGITHSPFAFPTSIFNFLVNTFFIPISEELYGRFLILYITAALFGRIPAVLISTFIFAISHNLSQPYEVLWAASMGSVNALLTIANGTLWPAIGIHIINNITVYFSHPF